jgi:hypothetical protein
MEIRLYRLIGDIKSPLVVLEEISGNIFWSFAQVALSWPLHLISWRLPSGEHTYHPQTFLWIIFHLPFAHIISYQWHNWLHFGPIDEFNTWKYVQRIIAEYCQPEYFYFSRPLGYSPIVTSTDLRIWCRLQTPRRGDRCSILSTALLNSPNFHHIWYSRDQKEYFSFWGQPSPKECLWRYAIWDVPITTAPHPSKLSARAFQLL